MLTFTKLLGMLLMPTGLLWVGLLVAAVWALRRRLRGLGLFLGLLFVVLTLSGNRQVGAALIVTLERQVPGFAADAPPLEALFVLGGGSDVDDLGRPCFGDAGDRIAEAARLWHAGRVKVLVASGVSDDATWGRRDAALETRVLWRGLGVPDSAILAVPEPCFITRDEIRAYQRLQALHGWRRVGLVSSAYHLPRAMALARRVGLDVIPIASDRRGRASRFQVWHLIPGVSGFERTQLACWEILGRWMGR